MSQVVEALFVSDLHLGSKQSNVDKIISLLDSYTPKHLFLVGDIIHGWVLNLKWNPKHSMVLNKIDYLSKNGTKVIWIPGNHDCCLSVCVWSDRHVLDAFFCRAHAS